MDKSVIKNFSVWASRKLIIDIKQRAFELGITEEAITSSKDPAKMTGKTLDKNELAQRKSLVLKIKEKGYSYVIEKAAYEWFKRLIALRYMEVNEYLPAGIRALSSSEMDEIEPDIIKHFECINPCLNDDELNALHAMLSVNDKDNLYRVLLIKQCSMLNEILPGLFEQLEDYTEILLPDNLLSDGSVIRRLVEDIPEEDYKDQVEIIGWFYQYYISDKKDEVYVALKKNVKITKENIPAATQLFTPDWIVKYMVENSLGRLWLHGHPDDKLRYRWKYYIDEAGQEPGVQNQLDEIREQSKKLKPEDIKVLDPAMGSGHILVYAFDVLYEIYKSAGYEENEIPKLILENNLYGLEIDDRAAQLAYFELMMKARSRSSGILSEKIDLNICSIQESNGIPHDVIEMLADQQDTLKKEEVEYLLDVFKDAKEYGSILDVRPVDYNAFKKRLDEIKTCEMHDNFELQLKDIILSRIPQLLKQLMIMSKKYDVVVTNPPYMGFKGINNRIGAYLSKNYSSYKYDLFAVFMKLALDKTKINGFNAMITQHSWMFLSSFEKLRNEYFNAAYLVNMLHLGMKAFEENVGTIVQTAAFISQKKCLPDYKTRFIDLTMYNSPLLKNKSLLKTIDNFHSGNCYVISIRQLSGIPGRVIAYWADKSALNAFSNKKLLEFANPKQGATTSDNKRFLREWYEVDFSDIGFKMCDRIEARESGNKWFPYNKGGEYRNWYGNNEYIINYKNDGEEIKKFHEKLCKTNPGGRLKNQEYYFKEAITYTFISSNISIRYSPIGFIFDVAGSSIFLSGEKLYIVLAYLNSKAARYFLKILNPTFNVQVGDIKNLPFIDIDDSSLKNAIIEKTNQNIKISKADWDLFETSWDFKTHPFLINKKGAGTIEEAFKSWSEFTNNQFNQLKSNEEKLNRIFIDIYGLKDELNPEESGRDVTIRKADRVHDIKSFISYAVGCMFGRYSIDAGGLIYAGGNWKDKWKVENGQWKVNKTVKDDNGNVIENSWVDASFATDEDNIIPITDDDYFKNDIISRFIEFVKVTFGAENLAENLDYIAETLGKKSFETSRGAIRRYFIAGFYKDHVQTYKKRPIYWLFDSGSNNGFKALIYMHRFDEFTVSKIRAGYLNKLQGMYEEEFKRLDIVIDDGISKIEKTNIKNKKDKLQKKMEECLKYDKVLANAASMSINLDLDDGVSVNYAKFQNIEVPQDEDNKPIKADLLAKI
jgi:hypothetical protein